MWSNTYILDHNRERITDHTGYAIEYEEATRDTLKGIIEAVKVDGTAYREVPQLLDIESDNKRSYRHLGYTLRLTDLETTDITNQGQLSSNLVELVVTYKVENKDVDSTNKGYADMQQEFRHLLTQIKANDNFLGFEDNPDFEVSDDKKHAIATANFNWEAYSC